MPEVGRGGIRHLRIGSRAAVGKRLLHGGVLAGVTRGFFLGAGRVEEVVTISARLRSAGVPTPEVIAAGWRPAAGPFGALALVTAAIEGGRNLLQLLPATRAGSLQRRLLLRAAGQTVARLEAAGFAHADLNLANLVATLEGEGARVAVVDLEGGRFVEAAGSPGATSGAGASAGLRRLMRSWEKWVEPKAPGSLRDLAAFMTGYSADRRARRRAARDLLRYRDGLGARRMRWRLVRASAVER